MIGVKEIESARETRARSPSGSRAYILILLHYRTYIIVFPPLHVFQVIYHACNAYCSWGEGGHEVSRDGNGWEKNKINIK